MHNLWIEFQLPYYTEEQTAQIKSAIINEHDSFYEILKIFLLMYGIHTNLALMEIESAKYLKAIRINKISRRKGMELFRILIKLKSKGIKLYHSYSFNDRTFDITITHKLVPCFRRNS